MTGLKKAAALLLSMTMLLALCCVGASAKTNPAKQTVGTVLFYVANSKGENILAAHVTVLQMEKDMEAGRIDGTNHNYSLLDRYVTTVHQEAQGFTVPDFVTYAQGKSTLASVRNLNLTFAGQDKIRFWEIDQTGFDNLDTYTYNDLYGVPRYNFPLLYEYWNYRTQDYFDPAGKMTRDQVIDYIFSHAEPETMLLSVRAFSQRYMVTGNKYGAGDYNMENYWKSSGLMDNERTIRVMKPMTKEELYNKTPTASDTRYWVANILLNMAKAPDITSLGEVAVPTATMTEDSDNYYITFFCATPGATILYNQNYISPGYTPTYAYTGETVTVPKSNFPSCTVTMACRAVKDGYTDAGVQTLTLTSSGRHITWANPFADVPDGAWYYDYVTELAGRGTVNGTSASTFEPDGTVTWGQALKLVMLATGSGEQSATDDHWASGYLSKANSDGLCSYYGSLDAAISRLELCRIAAKALKAEASAEPSPFSDTSDGTVLALYQLGVINGMGDGTFGAGGTVTRAQISKMIWRIYYLELKRA